MDNAANIRTADAPPGSLHPVVLQPFYEDESVTIYHGDARQIVPMLGRFDLLLTDPPYGLGDKWTGGNFRGKNGVGKLWGEKTPAWDVETLPQWLLDECILAASAAIVWGGNYYALPPSRAWLSWDKLQEHSGSECELAWSNLDIPAKVFRMSRIDAYQNKAETPKMHPTEKPLQLMSWCLKLAGNPKTILDPFAGSGTTGLSAKNLGLKAVLIEREERYCRMAAGRMSQGVLGLENGAELSRAERSEASAAASC